MKYHHYEAHKRNEFLARLTQIFQAKRSFVEELLSIRFRKSIRVNTLKVTDEPGLIAQIEASGVHLIKIPWVDHAYFIDEPEQHLADTPWFQTGKIYIQNASSLLPALILDPKPGDRIIDLCAAPGGKAAHIAALTNNQAELWVNDALPARIRKLQEVLTMQGVKVAQLMMKRAEELTVPPDQRFDKVLLDAQCSGEGMINLQHARALEFWSLDRIKKFHSLQKYMLNAAYHLLKPGGTLVYSTCTFAPEENEVVIDSFLKKHPDMQIEMPTVQVDFKMPGLTQWDHRSLNPNLSKAIRVLPNMFMEGFFVCKLRKTED